MANVAFKRGLQSALPVSAVDGVFYLTTDTNRLYVGQGTNLVELNKSITVVAKVADLPITGVAGGQFYYAELENILCVYSGTEWVQINPDTNTNDDKYVSGVSVTKVEATGDDTGKLKYKLTISQMDKNRISGAEVGVTDVETYFIVDPQDVATAAIDVAASVANGKATIKTNGAGAVGDGFAVEAGSNITIASNGTDGFTINGVGDTTYTLSTATDTAGAKVVLTDSDNRNTNAVFKAGTALSVNGDANGITYSHNNSGVTAGTYGSSASTPSSGESFNIPQIAVDAQGHIITASNQAITLPVDHDTKYKANDVSAANDGKITISISESNGANATTATSEAVLYHKITVDGGNEQTIYNQGSLGSFYSAGKVDELIEDAKAEMDSMTYCGAVASAAAVSSTPNKGDTYKASGDFVLNGTNVKIGDLIIYNGEDVDTTHAYDVTKWDIIPSGNEDTTYTFGTEGVTLWDQPSTSGAKDYFAEFAGDSSEISVDNVSGKIKVSHTTHASGSAGANTAGALAYGGGFKVPKITTNAAGHITAIEDVALTLPASDEVNYNFKADGDTTPYLALTADGTEKATVSIEGDSWIGAVEDDGAINLSHANAGTASKTVGPSANATPAHGESFKVPQVGIDGKGHVSVLEEYTITLPADLNTTYELSGSLSAANNIATMIDTLTPSTGGTTTSAWKLKSNNLTITKEGNDTIVADLVWGSF